MMNPLADPSHNPYCARIAAASSWLALTFGLGCGAGAEGATEPLTTAPDAWDAPKTSEAADAPIGDVAKEKSATGSGFGTDGSPRNCPRQSGPATAGTARRAGGRGTALPWTISRRTIGSEARTRGALLLRNIADRGVCSFRRLRCIPRVGGGRQGLGCAFGAGAATQAKCQREPRACRGNSRAIGVVTRIREGVHHCVPSWPSVGIRTS